MSTSSGADMPAAAEGVAAARWPSHTSAVLARVVAGHSGKKYLQLLAVSFVANEWQREVTRRVGGCALHPR